ncbi:MAG TPA: phage integrase family protein [Noviherbaspirillum sp.]|nr:phage integrase family protein [Noviherbaspirillum sp.]
MAGDDLTSREGRRGPSRSTTRRLHTGHFAFMRAVLQGLDQKASWQRYLGHEADGRDIRVVRQTIQWVRDEFAAAARRHARHGIARLVLIDAEQIEEAKDNRPSLDDFINERQLHDFSYAEQIEYYEEEYGKATQRQSRRSRLLAKQLDALHWLESIAVQPPRPGDPVSAWLNPVLAQHLERAGIRTLRALLDRINGVGRRWASTIPAIGNAKAGRIVEWLRQQEPALQLSVGPHVAQPRSAIASTVLHAVVTPSTAVVPLEKLVIPGSLNGQTGQFRAPQERCTLAANTDRQAVLAWLQTKQVRLPDGTAKPGHTYRAYFKEAERYLLWAVIERQVPLSSMTTDDCLAYCRFLANPTPPEKWCGPRGRGKWSPLWRPFEGPLSPRAQRQAITILKNLDRYLVETGYLSMSNWDAVPLPGEVVPRTNRTRSFNDAQWRFIRERLARLSDTSANQRLKLALPLLYETGMRLSEVVAARVGDLNRTAAFEGQGNPDEGWTLRLAGERRALHRIHLSADIIGQLRNYLVSRGFPPDLNDAGMHDAALLGRSVDVLERAPWSRQARVTVDPKIGITPGSLYEQIKDFFSACAKLAAEERRENAAAFASASTEWMRHTHTIHRSQRDLAQEAGPKASATCLPALPPLCDQVLE